MAKRTTILRTAVLVTSTTLAVVVCEVSLRWYAPIGDPFITHTPNLELVLRPNPAWLPNTTSPVRFTTDEYGFRVTRSIQYREKPPGTFRVFLIGGSTTENLYIDDARTFGAILERKLDALLRPTGRVAEVINAGRAGTVSADHFYLAWRVTSYQPDAIVYLMGANDMTQFLMLGFRPEATETKAFIRSSLFTFQLARRAYAAFREQSATGSIVRDETGASQQREREQSRRVPVRPMPEEGRMVFDSYRHNIRRLLALHRRHGLPAIFMTQPSLWQRVMPPELEARLGGLMFGAIAPVRYPTGDLEEMMDA